MLDSNVESFRNDSVSDLLVDNNSNSSGIDVEDGASAAVVVFVGHTLMDGTIDDNVHMVSDFVGGEGSSNVDGTGLLKSFSEFLSCLSSLTVAVGHL